CVQGIQFPFTF
nr:immunoglobulin light chain junction region [Macaca mulatta]